ncbi:Sec-independent protein translocase protein TatB [Arhodomonas aquaeolei]|uniref:Sec-independent protein translocase protein TatB n=1 Tax=Arhodomonas TaxID=2368 RepID=UPI000382871F|nr:Sec-independent protein translocase protein TatB [Arhodomonas aquaeolei]MCS4505082.1 Sec-independent protein translocase protein TatB [Arhodomonas aquaeolei]
MFDVGFWELLIIGVIALIVVGPERLPGLARTVGLWVGRARATFYSLRDEIERESDLQGLRDTERALRERGQEFRESVERTASEVRDTAERTRSEVEEAASASAESTTGGGDSDSDAGEQNAGTETRDRNGQ